MDIGPTNEHAHTHQVRSSVTPNPRHRTHPASGRAGARGQWVLCARVAVDAVGLTGHPFPAHGLSAAPSGLAAALASRTSRISIGTAVYVVPFHNPIRLAEETATLDILSGGRLIVGIGRGNRPVEFVGHGVGRKLHEEPQIPNYGRRGSGPRLKAGMTLAIEPMINSGTAAVKLLDDGWTVCTADGMPSAHFEHTVLITKSEPEILTWRGKTQLK